ncbi:hypothetical protein DHEL01_v201567 [Diaporthe helianthi]|uniref:Uncharacterized protein n=1 Tax=Diaporthe helianthi TaxID=158607 RepID=A0A2P5IC19_DIAHE|nr:hypothetical protein DHEL01_v201567 [Diaporthe helianthi]
MYCKVSLSALALAIHGATAQVDHRYYGNNFAVGYASGGTNRITKATWSLSPPPTPNIPSAPNDISASLWIGIASSGTSSPLVQPLLKWTVDQWSAGCGAKTDEWCVGNFNSTGEQLANQPFVTVPKGSSLSFEIESTADNMVSQKVSIDGNLVSSQTNAVDGSLAFLYSSNECWRNACGAINAYSWDSVTITLNEADNSFGETLDLRGANGSFLASDNGKVWTGTFNIDADYFPRQ